MNKIKEYKKEIEKEIERIKHLRDKHMKKNDCWTSSQLKIDKLVAEAKLKTINDILKLVSEEIDEWEKQNTEVLKTDDIIKKKIVIADYLKWDKVRELKSKLNLEDK